MLEQRLHSAAALAPSTLQRSRSTPALLQHETGVFPCGVRSAESVVARVLDQMESVLHRSNDAPQLPRIRLNSRRPNSSLTSGAEGGCIWPSAGPFTPPATARPTHLPTRSRRRGPRDPNDSARVVERSVERARCSSCRVLPLRCLAQCRDMRWCPPASSPTDPLQRAPFRAAPVSVWPTFPATALGVFTKLLDQL